MVIGDSRFSEVTKIPLSTRADSCARAAAGPLRGRSCGSDDGRAVGLHRYGSDNAYIIIDPTLIRCTHFAYGVNDNNMEYCLVFDKCP